MPDTPPAAAKHRSTLRDCWVAEVIRLRETRWGALDDAAAVRLARQAGGSFPERLLLRARILSRKDNLDQTIIQWQQLARLALLLLAALALFTGASAAAGALGDGSRPVNLVLALLALLGLPTLMLALWLAGALLQPGQTSTLANAWFWLTGKLARGPDAALAPRALLELTQQRNSTRAVSGVVSHALWLLAMLAMIATLLALLSARRYAFNWETTLLSPDTFVALTRSLGLLPGLLGFQMPSEAVIRASDGLQTLPDQAHALWSSWLIGCVVVYGLAPRAILVALNFFTARRRLTDCLPDPSLPGYAELHDRLMPAATRAGIDAPEPPLFTPERRNPGTEPSPHVGQAVLLGFELAPDHAWPPFSVPPGISDLGVIDSRTQRHRVLDQLITQTPQRLLIVCDAAQTPDRGSLAFLAELASTVSDMHIALYPSADQAARLATWQQKLAQAGFPAQHIHTDAASAQGWLAAKAVSP